MSRERELEDVDLSVIKTRSVTGVVTLISRSFVQRIIATLGFFALTVFLDRPEIGLFVVVNDMVSILGYFSDIGLAASLIQKKETVSVADLRTTFTLQQIIVIASCVLMVIFSPAIFDYYQISGSGTWLYYSLLLAFFLASLKTIPSVILERQLKFEILAVVEVLETVSFYAMAVFLAWQGRGLASYAWAVTLRGILGTFLLYRLSPWPIGLALSAASLKSLLSFGIPYQLNSVMAVVKDRFVNIVLLKIISADGIGIIGWAQNLAQTPLRFIMDNVTKVTFPSFSRLQGHAGELKRGLEKTLFFITSISFPVLACVAILTPLLVKLIPRYSKWEVALLPLGLYCFNSALASVSTPLTNTLNALGKVRINTYLMIMWTALTWTLTPYLAMKYGFTGVAYAAGLIALSSAVPVIIVRRFVSFSLTSSVLKPALATLIMAIATWYMSLALPNSLLSIFLNLFISALIYFLAIFLLVGQSLITDVRQFVYVLFKKK